MENYLTPAMKEGFVNMLYPNTPNHPRQKYLTLCDRIGYIQYAKEDGLLIRVR